MNKNTSKKIKIQLIIISSCVIGSAYSASLFGVDLTAPTKVVKTGVGALSQVFKPEKPELPTFPFAGNSQPSTDSHANSKPDKTKPKQPSTSNQLSQENNQFSDTRKPIKFSEKVPGFVESSQTTDPKQESDGFTPGWSENGTDYTTTESIDYEVQYFIITCCLIGSAYNASLYSAHITAPAKVNSGMGEISQKSKPPKTQYTSFPFGGRNQFNNEYFNEDSFDLASIVIFEKNNPRPLPNINKSTQDNILFSDTRIPIKDDHGPDTENDSGTTTRLESEYEITTVEPLNRNGAPPEVVASLLG